jgi:hypothetical protein
VRGGELKVLLCEAAAYHDNPAEMHMEPQSDEDRRTLSRLIDRYQIVGCGRNVDTMEPSHVQLRLTEKARAFPSGVSSV